MKKLFTLFAAFLLTLSAMADVYKIDPSKEITASVDNLNGVIGVITNLEGTKVFSLGGGNEWDITSIDLKDWGSKFADYNYILFEKLNISPVLTDIFKIRIAKADKSFYSPSWSEPANDGCLNVQVGETSGVFVGGNKGRNGTDGTNYGIWQIKKTATGYEIKNYGRGSYLVPGPGQSDNAVSVKFYSALAVDIPASVEAAYKAIPAGVKNDAVDAAYATAKANPTQANLNALKAAIADINKTSLINNAGIDGNTQGWTCNLPQGGGGPMKPSNDAMEFWAGSANPRNDASFDYYQEITVPNGKYVLQAEMFNSSNGEEGTGHAPNGNAGLYASSGSNEVFVGVTTDSEVLAQYTTDVLTVKDGKIRIGVKSKGYMSARWFVADNFKLWYAGDDTDQAAADAVVEKINAIGTVEYTEACKALIDAAREAYDALTADQKALITEAQLKVLTDAEAAYAELKAAAEKAAADQAAADAVVEKINAIGTVEYTEASKALIDEARAAYDALTDDQKALVTAEQLKVLTDAEAAYAELKAAAEKAAADQAAADAVVASINAIGTVEYTEACKALIDAAREAYDALTDDQKALVTAEQLKVLTDAEAAYAELKVAAEKAAADQATADAVVASINAIGTVEYTEACKALIDAAREAYDALTAEQKALVTEAQQKVLTDAETAYAELKVAAEKTAADQAAADAVVEKINAIGTVEYTEACMALIDEARAAYDALTDDQKALVTAEQLKVLTDAETAYAELKAAAEKAAADQAAADAVVEKINAIGTVEYTEACKALIDEARAAYDALTDDQKALVTAEQLKVLTDAEAEYKRLKDIATGIASVNATSAQKDGKYIKNGKVYIVKSGKKYNEQGTRIR